MQNKDSVSVVASYMVCEMTFDPDQNLVQLALQLGIVEISVSNTPAARSEEMDERVYDPDGYYALLRQLELLEQMEQVEKSGGGTYIDEFGQIVRN